MKTFRVSVEVTTEVIYVVCSDTEEGAIDQAESLASLRCDGTFLGAIGEIQEEVE